MRITPLSITSFYSPLKDVHIDPLVLRYAVYSSCETSYIVVCFILTRNQLNCNREIVKFCIFINETFKLSPFLIFCCLYPLYNTIFQVFDASVAEILSTFGQMYKKYLCFFISVTIASNYALPTRITKPNAYGMWEYIAPFIVLAGRPQSFLLPGG